MGRICSDLSHRLPAIVVADGGRVPHNSVTFPGCGDKAPPRESFVTRIPFPLTFACESENWGGGGVAFLLTHPVPADRIAVDGALVRCYRISFAQWRDVVSQENAGIDLSGSLTPTVIEHLRGSGPGSVTELPHKTWYSRLLYLGDHDGTPMLTFTCPAGFLSRHAFNPPGRAYASTLVAGLVEAAGLTPAEAVAYVRHAHARAGHHSEAAEVSCPASAGASRHTAWLEGGVPALAAMVEQWLEPGSCTHALVRAWAGTAATEPH
jgi:hypothetical protein